MPSAMLIYTTAPSRAVAESLAEGLIRLHLVACVNILAPATSLYHWQGAIARAEEYPILIKTTPEKAHAVESYMHHHHPYDVPAFLIIPTESSEAFAAYLQQATTATDTPTS